MQKRRQSRATTSAWLRLGLRRPCVLCPARSLRTTKTKAEGSGLLLLNGPPTVRGARGAGGVVVSKEEISIGFASIDLEIRTELEKRVLCALAHTTRQKQKRVWVPPANSGTRARAPLPSLRPLQVLLVHGGGFGVLLYIGFLGPRRWILVLRDLLRRNAI
jgi:hypothetical protein